jgi:integrase/recombinase XerD
LGKKIGMEAANPQASGQGGPGRETGPGSQGGAVKRKIVMAPDRELTLEDVFGKFINSRKAMNAAPATIRAYTSCFAKFTKFCGEGKAASEVAKEDVIEFILWIEKNNPKIAKTSVNTYLRHVRAVLYFAMESGATPRFKVSLVRAEKKIKETYDDDELERLLKKPGMASVGFTEYRNWVIVNYLMGTGNRSRTLRELRIGDIDFAAREIKLKITKNKKAYAIPLSGKLESVLREYLLYRKGQPDDFLFCTEYGEQITADGLTTIVRKYNHSRGVAKTSVHLFRHTFAKKWVLNGGDMFRLQKILGHSSLDMVKEYVTMFADDLKLGFVEFNPLDNLSFAKEKGKIEMKK